MKDLYTHQNSAFFTAWLYLVFPLILTSSAIINLNFASVYKTGLPKTWGLLGVRFHQLLCQRYQVIKAFVNSFKNHLKNRHRTHQPSHTEAGSVDIHFQFWKKARLNFRKTEGRLLQRLMHQKKEKRFFVIFAASFYILFSCCVRRRNSRLPSAFGRNRASFPGR